MFSSLSLSLVLTGGFRGGKKNACISLLFEMCHIIYHSTFEAGLTGAIETSSSELSQNTTALYVDKVLSSQHMVIG